MFHMNTSRLPKTALLPSFRYVFVEKLVSTYFLIGPPCIPSSWATVHCVFILSSKLYSTCRV